MGSTPPASPTAAAPSAAAAVVVEDATAELAPGQMRRSDFLTRLRTSVMQAAERALTTSSLAALVRPRVERQIESAFATYGGQDTRTLEALIRRQIPGAGAARNAGALIAAVVDEVHRNVVEALPPTDANAGVFERGTAVVANAAQTVRDRMADLGRAFLKPQDGRSTGRDDPLIVRSQLTGGRSLDSGTRARMEDAFGQDFADVRVHTDARATALSNDLAARAFTVGSDIAFGTGEYRPGTPVGDALLAHELAHVVQQRSAGSSATVEHKGSGNHSALEADADASAVSAVVSIWTGAKDLARRIGRNAGPALRSGLRLQSCNRGRELSEVSDKSLGERIVKGMNEANAPKPNLDSGVFYWPEYQRRCLESPETASRWDEAKYRLGYTAAPQLEKTGTFRWRLRAGASASQAIRAWLRGLTVAECASTATAIYYDTIRAAVGDRNFDHHFRREGNLQGLVISQFPAETPLKDFLLDVSASGGLKPGDWYYFRNHRDYQFKHPAGLWQGESAVYMGTGTDGARRWRGFGVNELTETQMLEELFNAYNADRTEYDLRKLREAEATGGLDPQYRFRSEGGTLTEKLADPQDVLAGGGGLKKDTGEPATGWRLSDSKIAALRER